MVILEIFDRNQVRPDDRYIGKVRSERLQQGLYTMLPLRLWKALLTFEAIHNPGKRRELLRYLFVGRDADDLLVD